LTSSPHSGNRADAPDVLGGEIEPARAAIDPPEPLAREADGRRVDDRQELLEVVDEDAVEERLVPVEERDEMDVSLDRCGLLRLVVEDPLDLLLH